MRARVAVCACSNTVWASPLYHTRAIATAFMWGIAATFWALSSAVQPLWLLRYYASGDAAELPAVAVVVALGASFYVALEVVCVIVQPRDLLNWAQVR